MPAYICSFALLRLGEMYLRKCNIGSKSVTGLPDVCFETLPNLANSTSTESGNLSTESENSSTVSEISSSTTSTESIPKLILVTEVREHRSKIQYFYFTSVVISSAVYD